MFHILKVAQVMLRGYDPHGITFEVKQAINGRWFYHEKRGGNIITSSQEYFSKSNAKRAAYSIAFITPGSQVKVLTGMHFEDSKA